MSELVFQITQEADGGFVAEALGEGIFTEADTWDELRENVREAVRAYYFDKALPQAISLLRSEGQSCAAGGHNPVALLIRL